MSAILSAESETENITFCEQPCWAIDDRSPVFLHHYHRKVSETVSELGKCPSTYRLVKVQSQRPSSRDCGPLHMRSKTLKHITAQEYLNLTPETLLSLQNATSITPGCWLHVKTLLSPGTITCKISLKFYILAPQYLSARHQQPYKRHVNTAVTNMSSLTALRWKNIYAGNMSGQNVHISLFPSQRFSCKMTLKKLTIPIQFHSCNGRKK